MIGIDEVGRGCWAGPLLVVAARAYDVLPLGLKDSKKLSKVQREAFLSSINTSCDLGEGWVAADEIDELGLADAMRMAVQRALSDIVTSYNEEIIMDGSVNYCSPKYTNVTCVPKADDKYPIVSAASIYAKVLRDKYMAELSGEYLKYQFKSHVGYGTKLHMDMLALYGVSNQHRLSFAPLNKFATL